MNYCNIFIFIIKFSDFTCLNKKHLNSQILKKYCEKNLESLEIM